MRDKGRLNAEIKLLRSHFGDDRVLWEKQGRWIMVREWKLPPKMSKTTSNVLVLIPENFGNGEPLRDAFVDPDLKALNPKTGRWEAIPHYFAEYPYARLLLGTKEEWQRQGWQYICIHEKSDKGARSNILNYLAHIYKFLSDPFRDWRATFRSYGG